jgi:hypothetical protein
MYSKKKKNSIQQISIQSFINSSSGHMKGCSENSTMCAQILSPRLAKCPQFLHPNTRFSPQNGPKLRINRGRVRSNKVRSDSKIEKGSKHVLSEEREPRNKFLITKEQEME